MKRLFLATASADESAQFEMAICTSLIPDGAPDWVKLMPLGRIAAGAAKDGRVWNNSQPEQVVLASKAAIDLVIDYEHQTDLASKNGQIAPAAGWIKSMEVRDDGIWGKVEWTAKAAAYLNAKEYRYLSPTFIHTKTGLQSAKPKDGEFVTMATYQDTAKQLKALQDSTSADKAGAAVEKAMASGKISPAQKDWAIALATRDLPDFDAFVENAPQIVDPDASANQGSKKALATALDVDEKAMASALGLTEAEFLKSKNEGAE